MSEIEEIQAKLVEKRKKILESVSSLVKQGKADDAIKQVEDAAKIVEEIGDLDKLKEKEKEIEKFEGELNELPAKKQSEDQVIVGEEKELDKKIEDLIKEQEAKIKKLEEERDLLLSNIETLVECGKSEEAVKQVFAPGS